MLPLEVLERAGAEITNYQGSGMSVMEMSHRSKPFANIIETAEADPHDPAGTREGRRTPGHLRTRLHARRSRHFRRGAAHLPLEPAPAPPHGLRTGEVGLMSILFKRY